MKATPNEYLLCIQNEERMNNCVVVLLDRRTSDFSKTFVTSQRRRINTEAKTQQQNKPPEVVNRTITLIQINVNPNACANE